jgi:hypothetical protein
MNTELKERLDLARAVLAQRLSSVYKTWTMEGDTVVGPGTLAVRVEDQHETGPNHFDIGFILNRLSVPTRQYSGIARPDSARPVLKMWNGRLIRGHVPRFPSCWNS